jgi:prepilin-type N-terminal cleavage/methylation domain-containing protein
MHFPEAGLRRAFTLIELLVVIAIIAILAVVVVLTLNPAQLLAQSRDAQRASDIATIDSGLGLYVTDRAGTTGFSLGAASTSYVSLASASSNCASLSLASSAFPYVCSSFSNGRSPGGGGWIPVDFQAISAGSPFGSIPVDPINQSSSDLYYTYETAGGLYAVNTFFESEKYAKIPAADMGIDPVLLDAGTGVVSLPDAGRGLMGYWPLNEGMGSSAIDRSGNGDAGTWSGAPGGTSGFYAPGKTAQWAGYFNSNNANYISLASFPSAVDPASWAFWVNPISVSGGSFGGGSGSSIIDTNENGGSAGYDIGIQSNDHLWFWPSGGNDRRSVGTIPLGTWTFVVCTYDGTTLRIYFNGVLDSAQAMPPPDVPTFMKIGAESWTTGYLNGSLNDLRIYDRVLSPAEVQEMYYAER